MSKLERFKELREELIQVNEVADVLLDEDFIPPNKSAAFTPYDAVICVSNIESESAYKREASPSLSEIIERNSSNCDNVEEFVEEEIEGLKYDRIVGVEKNETYEPGEFLVYVSLESFEEYKSRW